MTAPTPMEAHLVVVKITISSVLTTLGAMTARGFSITANANAVPLPRDTASPDTPPGTARIFTSIDSQITGTVRYHKALQDAVDDLVGTSSVMNFILPGAGSAGGGTWAGTFAWTQFEVSGDDGDHMVANVTFELDGDRPTFTAAS